MDSENLEVINQMLEQDVELREVNLSQSQLKSSRVHTSIISSSDLLTTENQGPSDRV